MVDLADNEALHRAISDGTLPNDAALTHLVSSRDVFENRDSSDAPLTSDQRARILHIFDDAIHVQATKAVEAHQSICQVLKKTLTEVARVVYEAKMKNGARKTVAADTLGMEKMSDELGGFGAAPVTSTSEGGGKREEATPGSTQKQRGSLASGAGAEKTLPVSTAPSPTVKRRPSFEEGKKPGRRKRRYLKKPPKSSAYVEDSSSDADGEHASDMKVPATVSERRTASKRKMAASGGTKPKHKCVEVNGKRSLIVKLPVRVPEHLLADNALPEPQPRTPLPKPKLRGDVDSKLHANAARNGPSVHVPSSKMHFPDPSVLPVSDDDDPAWESDAAAQDTCLSSAPASPFLASHPFPPYPPLSERELYPFSKGVDIALTNIMDDRQSNPHLTLLELVQQLENNKPVLKVKRNEHDDRKSVLDGGEYVYAAVKEFCDDASKEMDRGRKGRGEQKLAVEEVTRAFLNHAQREHEMAEKRLNLRP